MPTRTRAIPAAWRTVSGSTPSVTPRAKLCTVYGRYDLSEGEFDVLAALPPSEAAALEHLLTSWLAQLEPPLTGLERDRP